MSRIALPTSAHDLQISAPHQENDAPKLIDLLCKTYSGGSGYWKGERACRNGYLLNSNYDWTASRIGRLGNEMVTHFGIWDFQIRVGCARIRVAGIGAVATHDYYRKRGLMRQTANAALAALEAVTLRISDGKIQLLPPAPSKNSVSGGEAIAQLMFGTDEPHETIGEGSIRLRGEAKVLVPVLFPNEYPALSTWDRF